MKIEDWTPGEHNDLLASWIDKDPRCIDPLRLAAVITSGAAHSERALDAVIPERGVAINETGPCGIVGMQRLGDSANVHVIVNPDLRSFSVASKVYDVALDYARRCGVRHAVGVIPQDNRPALKMALRKGFSVIPAIVMVKAL